MNLNIILIIFSNKPDWTEIEDYIIWSNRNLWLTNIKQSDWNLKLIHYLSLANKLFFFLITEVFERKNLGQFWILSRNKFLIKVL
jgi:hypothetical protein